MPEISIITPAYNGAKTIVETIKSVLEQTFTDWELIVINDGSQDSTLELVSSIQDPRIQIFSYANSGAQKSRNRGIGKARGKYLAFLDADDLWTRDKLEAQWQALQKHPEAGVAYSWTNYIDEKSEFWRRGSYISASGNVFAKLLLIDFVENGSNPLVRADTIAEVGDFDETLVAGQDWDMWLRLAAGCDFVVVSRPQILYRQYPSYTSWSNNVERRELGFQRVMEKALEQAPESIKGLKRQIVANRYKCLVVDALAKPAGRKRALTAARFIYTAVINDLYLLRTKALIKVLFIISVMALLPPQQAQALLSKMGKLSNVQTLLGYLRLDHLEAR